MTQPPPKTTSVELAWEAGLVKETYALEKTGLVIFLLSA
jgi:hypothetical protein